MTRTLAFGGVATAALLVLTSVAPAFAAPQKDGSFAVSSVGTNNQIARGPDGSMWVTLDGGTTEVARVTSAGIVTEFDLPGVSNPVGIVAAAGKLWVDFNGGVASFSPADPSGTVATTAIATLTDPRIMTRATDGSVWTASTDKVFRIPPANPAGFTQFATATTKVKDAKAITASGDGTVWVADGLGGAQVVNVTAAGVGTAYATGGGNQGIAAGPKRQVAFANPLANPQLIGRVTAGGTPSTRTTPQKDPFGVTFAADGAYWIAQFADDSLARLTRTGGYSTPIRFPAGSGPRQLSAGPDKTIWVTLDQTDRIAKVKGVAPAPPQTTITKAPPATVTFQKPRRTLTFRFTSSRGQSTFQCRLWRKGNDRGQWRTCTSAKRYKVKPGRFRFQVRATAGGVTDPTPALARVRVKR